MKPNILWIVTTQWRAQACGYAGDPNARTPVLDALAAQSINYTQAVTPHPFGPFARAAMLTGLPSPQNGVRHYDDPLPQLVPTIAHALGAFDYRTAYFGKWHLAPRERDVPLVGEAHAKTIVAPENRGGFEFWEGFEGGFQLNDPWFHGTRLPLPVQFQGYQSDVLCQRAATWLTAQRSSDGPWFAVVSLEAPHPPYREGAAGIAPAKPESLQLRPNLPKGGKVEARARVELAGYYAHIAATDRAIGRLLAAVGLANTVVAFTSVHGDMHGSHGLFRKGWPQEESVRVPLLVCLPGGDARNDESPVSIQDLPAMTQAWAVGMDWKCARDFAPISMPSVVDLPEQCDRIWHGIRSKDRKLVLGTDDSPWLFYDLAPDPHETVNLALSPERGTEIEQLITRI
ncbi:MAG: sulfatase-like hydrolase/transferase [Cephaloticoccus sp.]|nr:sulfatase-like hydrolase/transferase [Cephaloticoccus sp.]MCF7759053.1 sulfatase-like hydrolase/transferase [Cephaloticoccus sp.]